MEKYCKSCGRVFDDLNFKLCPYCGSELATRHGRQPIPRKLRHEVFKRDGYRCRECGASKDETSLEIDHIVPVARGGTNDIDNLQTLCRECNRMKHTDEWVGGEADSTQLEQLINLKKEEISNLEYKLDSTPDENEVIDSKYKIMKLNEEIEGLSVELEDVKAQEQENLGTHIKAQEQEQLYKRIYVSVTAEKLNKLKKELKRFNYTTKEQYVKYLFDISSPEFDKAKKHMELGEYYEAILIFNDLEEIAKSEYIFYLKGVCHLELLIEGLYTPFPKISNQFEADRCFEKAIKINPLNIEVKLKIVELNLEKQWGFGTLELCDEILDNDPNWTEAWTLKGRTILSSILDEYSFNPNPNEAINAFNKAIELDSNNADAWYYKGIVYHHLDQCSQMLECYDKCIIINPNHDKALNSKGQYYMNQLEDFNKALTFFNKAIDINPNAALYWKNKGFCLKYKNELDAALNAYNKAFELNPGDSSVGIEISNLKYSAFYGLENKIDLEKITIDWKKCQRCGNKVPVQVTKCHYCGHEF